jgi:hypothetical protein
MTNSFIVRKARRNTGVRAATANANQKTQAEIFFGSSVRQQRQERYRAAIKHWLDDTGIKWDICATLHTPKDMRDAEQGYTANWLAKQLRKYFNELDRIVHKAAHRNRGERILRWVVLEYEENVGWHAHIALKTPDGKTSAELIQLADKLWRKKCKRYTSKHFDERLTKIEEIQGRFIEYMNKFVTGEEDSKGLFDDKNTHLHIN